MSIRKCVTRELVMGNFQVKNVHSEKDHIIKTQTKKVQINSKYLDTKVQ